MIDVIYKEDGQEVYLATFTSLSNDEIFVDALIERRSDKYDENNLAYRF